MRSAANVLLSLREDEAIARDAILQNQPAPDDDHDHAPDSDSPIFDAFVEQGGGEAIATLTNFTITEFYLLYGHVEEVLVGHWTCGRGKKSDTKPMDAFLMMLCVLKHYATWHKHALDFGFKPPTFEKLVHRIMDICEPLLLKAFVTSPSLSDHRANARTFTHYPYGLYAVDVKFQPALRPSGRKPDATSPINTSSMGSSTGAVSHITILSNHIENRDQLRKSANESALDDHGEGVTQYQDSWALLADTGCQGTASMFVAHYACHIQVERKLVRQGMLNLLRFTNFHARINPLRSDGGAFYRLVAAKYNAMAHQRRTRRAEPQRA
ncbi:hypothetical protein PI126_g19300 [Phytophthora idaei]|nr:hypothetical protein PI126_g19300 [Phytophthora idaei]